MDNTLIQVVEDILKVTRGQQYLDALQLFIELFIDAATAEVLLPKIEARRKEVEGSPLYTRVDEPGVEAKYMEQRLRLGRLMIDMNKTTEVNNA